MNIREVIEQIESAVSSIEVEISCIKASIQMLYNKLNDKEMEKEERGEES